MNWGSQKYTGSDSKIGGCQGGALVLGQAPGVPTNVSFEGVEADPKSSGCPTSAGPIFETRAV
jgi:hypothetical protein